MLQSLYNMIEYQKTITQIVFLKHLIKVYVDHSSWVLDSTRATFRVPVLRFLVPLISNVPALAS